MKRDGHAQHGSAGLTAHRQADGIRVLVDELVDELVDAHADTLEIADEPRGEIRWAAHLEYLRALHRTANEILARADLPGVRTPPSR
jgi:alpha-D-ribose 1-methylphosphonate 5-triphosphate diphosphatase PhnM